MCDSVKTVTEMDVTVIDRVTDFEKQIWMHSGQTPHASLTITHAHNSLV